MTELMDSGSEKRAVVFVADKGFIVPTIVAACQVRLQLHSDPIARVFIVLSGIAAADVAVIEQVCEAENIEVLSMPSIELPASVSYNPTHVPTSALGRFFAVDLLPPEIEHIVYLDGDIQILGDIRPLIRHEVAPGRIAAANDKYWLGSFGRHRSQKTYLTGLGVSAEEYFNSGVLAFRRQTWTQDAPRAMAFFLENSTLCRFHDQSALNSIFKGRREQLHPRYNFISDYTYFDAKRQMDPVIVHFTGGLKPWFYKGPPWNGRFYSSYQRLIEKHPTLRPFLKTKTEREQTGMLKFARRQISLHMRVFPFLPLLRRWRAKRYLSRTAFAVR